MLKHNPNIFKATIRDGVVYNNNNSTEGIDCDAPSTQYWRLGYDIMKALREVFYFFQVLFTYFERFALEMYMTSLFYEIQQTPLHIK